MLITLVTSLSRKWGEIAQICIFCMNNDKKIKMDGICWWQVELISLFLRHGVMTSLTQNWVKRGPNFHFFNQLWQEELLQMSDDARWHHFEMRFFFKKPFSKYFHILPPFCDVVISKLRLLLRKPSKSEFFILQKFQH